MFKLLTKFTYDVKHEVNARELKYLKYSKEDYLISTKVGEYYGENVTYVQVQTFLRSIGVTQYSLNLVEGLVAEESSAIEPKVESVEETKEPEMGEPSPAEATYYYLLSNKNSGVKKTYRGWSNEAKTPTENQKYLWQYVEVTYPDGAVDSTEPIILDEYTLDTTEPIISEENKTVEVDDIKAED